MNRIKIIVALLLTHSTNSIYAAPNQTCQEVSKKAQQMQFRISGDQSGMVVVGQVPAFVYDAPDLRCQSTAISLSPGARVDALAEFDGFIGIIYIRKEDGRDIVGWVERNRLEMTGTGIGPAYR